MDAADTGDARQKVTVYLLDDQMVVRAGLQQLIDSQRDMAVVGESGTCAQARAEVARLRPQVLVTEQRLPDGQGVALWRELRSRVPGLTCLIFTLVDDDSSVLEAAMAGASGYVLKDAHGDQVVQAVRIAASGQTLLGPATVQRLMEQAAGKRSAGAQG